MLYKDKLNLYISGHHLQLRIDGTILADYNGYKNSSRFWESEIFNTSLAEDLLKNSDLMLFKTGTKDWEPLKPMILSLHILLEIPIKELVSMVRVLPFEEELYIKESLVLEELWMRYYPRNGVEIPLG